MDACRECPLSPGNLLDQHCSWPRKVMNISYLKEIELHVATSISCLHPELKNLVLSGPLEGSTLLLVACQDENLEAVRYMVENWQVDVKTPATHYDYYQPTHPFDEPYHRTKTERSTPLLVASRKNAALLIKYLLAQGADIMARDSSGYTPIFIAAGTLRLPQLDFLLKREDVDRMEKVDAAEMAAAQLLLSNRQSRVELAKEYLRQALLLRQIEVGPIQETPVMTLKSGRTVEWTTSASIEHLDNLWPSEQHLQACLIALRLCSARSWRAVSKCLHQVNTLIKSLHEQSRFVDFLDVIWNWLQTITRFYSCYQEGLSTQAVFIVQFLFWMLQQLEKDNPILTSTTLDLPLQVLIATHSFGHPTDYVDDKMRRQMRDQEISKFFLLYLIFAYIASRSEMITNSIRELLYKLVFQDHRCSLGLSILHYALMCVPVESKSLATIQLLLECHSDPNASDHYGNGPMHLLAYRYDGKDDQALDSAARLLLEHGAYLCKVNLAGETATQAVGHWRGRYLPNWCRPVPKLICICAKFIRSKNVAYEESDLPATLHAFLVNHSQGRREGRVTGYFVPGRSFARGARDGAQFSILRWFTQGLPRAPHWLAAALIIVIAYYYSFLNQLF